MADVVTDIRDRIVTMISSMTVLGGYNFDYDSTSVNPAYGDVSRTIQPGETLSDTFPWVFVECGDEVTLMAPEDGPNGNMYINDIEMIIEAIPDSDLTNVDLQCNKILEDFKKLFFADPCLKNLINSGTTPKCRTSYYVGNERRISVANTEAGGVRFKLVVRYGQDIDSVGSLV